MGLDNFGETGDYSYGGPKNTEGQTVNTQEIAEQAVLDAKEYLGHSPLRREFDEIKDEIGYSTGGRDFKQNTGISFNEAKERAGLNYDTRGKSIEFTEDMRKPTEELGYILGVVLSDGSVYEQSNGSKVIGLNAADKDFVEQFGKALCYWTGLKWSGFSSEETEVSTSGPIEQEGNREDQWIVKKGISDLYEFLNQYQEGEFKITELLDNPEEFKIGLLRGLWDGEGSVEKSQKRIQFSNTDDRINLLYLKLVEDLIGVELDLNGTWTDEENKASKKKGEFRVTKKKEYGARDICLPAKYYSKFYNTVQPTIERKREIFEKHIE